MAGLVDTEASRLLTSSLVGGTKTIAVTSTAPTSTAAGTEFGTRQGVTFGTVAGVAGVQTTNNTGAVTFTNMTANTWVGINVYEGASERRWFGALSQSKTTQSGDSLSFATAAVAIGLS